MQCDYSKLTKYTNDVTGMGLIPTFLESRERRDGREESENEKSESESEDKKNKQKSKQLDLNIIQWILKYGSELHDTKIFTQNLGTI